MDSITIAIGVIFLLIAAASMGVGLWRWRRARFRVRLKTLLLVTAVVGLLLFVAVEYVLPAVQRHRAFFLVRRSRGSFYRAAITTDGLPHSTNIRSPWDTAEIVTFDDDVAARSSAHALRWISELKSINFGEQVTDVGIRKVVSPRPTTAPLLLSFECPQMTDDALADIGQMSGLNELFFMSSGISDEGLKRLTEVQGLKLLSLWEHVWEKGSGRNRYRFGPKGYAAIAQLKDMELIRIRGHVVSDESVRQLHGLVNAKKVHFVYCIVSSAAIEKLRLALPKCEVTESECVEPDAPKPDWF